MWYKTTQFRRIFPKYKIVWWSSFFKKRFKLARRAHLKRPARPESRASSPHGSPCGPLASERRARAAETAGDGPLGPQLSVRSRSWPDGCRIVDDIMIKFEVAVPASASSASSVARSD